MSANSRSRPCMLVPAFLAAALCVTGCSTGPASSAGWAASTDPSGPLSPAAAYERRLREQAAAASGQAHLADAAVDLELLTVLRPDVADYRLQLADVNRQIDSAVAWRLPRAAERAQRGDLDGATQLYLAVLALQPSNDAAADALRAIERERNKRNYLGKSARVTSARQAMRRAATASAGAASGAEKPAAVPTSTSALTPVRTTTSDH